MAETEKSWERPWSTNEIRKNSDKWTLAGDVGLLKHLEEFSHHLISRTHEMEKVVDTLMHQSKETCAKVNNVINDFQMLSNSKFVENRVYDEEITETKKDLNQEIQPKSKEQREAEMVPRVKEALQLGLSVLDTAFEQIDMDDETSDSEEEEDLSPDLTHLKPKDVYEHRPLPYVIGSDEFQNDDFAGLRYMIEDDLVLDDDNLSASPDEIISETDESESDIEDELNYVQNKPELVERQQSVVTEAKDNKPMFHENLNRKLSDSEGSDLFGEEENGYASASSVEEKLPEPTKSKTAFLEELGSKIKPVPPMTRKESDAHSVQSVKSIPVEKKTEESDDLFANEDDLFEDDTSPFGKNKGLFTTNTKFGSADEDVFEDDLFGITEKTQKVKKDQPQKMKQEVTVKKKQPESLFDDDENEDDLFGSFSSSTTASTEPQIGKQVSKVINTKSSENVRKASPPSSLISTKESIKSVTATKPSNDSLFGTDSDDDLFSDIKTTQNKKSFTFSNEDENDLFGISSKNTKEVKLEEKVIKPEATEKPPLLFDDENEDDFDLFGISKALKSEVKKEEVTSPQKEMQPPTRSIKRAPDLTMFDDNANDDIDLFLPVKNVKKASPSPPLSKDTKDILEEDVVPVKEHISIFESENVVIDNKQELLLENQVKPAMDIPASGESNKITFDRPVDSVNTLTALNKDRAKVQVKRRKPTRKGRQAVQSIDNEQSESLEENVTPVIKPSVQKDSSDDLFSIVDTPREKKITQNQTVSPVSHKSQERDKKNLMSQLMSEAAVSKIGKRNSLLGIEEDDDDISDLLLGGNKNKGKGLGLPSDVLDKKDIFSPDDDDDDDIFKSVKSKDTVSQNSDDIFADAGDDIFANMDKEKYGMFPKTELDDDDDDDDIFSNLGKPSKSTATKENKQVKDEKKKLESIFDDPLGGLSLND